MNKNKIFDPEQLLVQKYGGTSVGNPTKLGEVAENIKQFYLKGHALVIVVSAMGQYTDELILLAKTLNVNPPSREMDMLLTAGERISAALLSMALHKMDVPCVSLTGSQCGIITDNVHGNARIKRITPFRVVENLEQNRVVIVAGFQGVSEDKKEITTLGRGGSDLTAVSLAKVLGAKKCMIYTDVSQVATIDPNLCEEAMGLESISYNLASKISQNGAQVLHHRATHISEMYQVPLEVLKASTQDIHTSVGAFESENIKMITQVDDLVLIHFDKLSADFIEAVRRADGLIYHLTSFEAVIKESVYEKLNLSFKKQAVTMIAVFGAGFRRFYESYEKIENLCETVLTKIEDDGIYLFIDPKNAASIAKKIHRTFIE